ncbi:MAG: BTAD domain-containing putative transcriptional regulator [Acidimicrobiales bacterium]
MSNRAPTADGEEGPLQFWLLGGLRATRDGVALDLGRPKQRLVLTLLLLEAGRVLPAERLAQLLWGQDGPKERASLQAYLSNLRRILEPDRATTSPSTVIVRRAPGYLLAVDRQHIDVLRFEDLVEAGGSALARGDVLGAEERLQEARALWTGDPTPEFADELAVVAATRRLRAGLATVLEGEADLALRRGDADAAVRLLEPVLDQHPTRERMHAEAALALYRVGRQTDALHVVQALRERLVEASGLEPTPELRDLEGRILVHAPDLAWTPVGPTARAEPAVPETGVEPEAVTGAAMAAGAAARALVGRDQVWHRLAAVLAEGSGVVTVTGEAGIGKTTVVDHLVALAESRTGVVCAWVACPESGGSPPYWPLVELADQLRARGVAVGDPAPMATDSVSDPFRLAHDLADRLRDGATPVLLVLDDLQWADGDTLRALTHLVPQMKDTPALLVTTIRPVPRDASVPLANCLDELARTRVADLALQRLSLDDVARMLEARAEAPVPPDVVAHVHDRTSGNPLFVRELADLLASEGRLHLHPTPPPPTPGPTSPST